MTKEVLILEDKEEVRDELSAIVREADPRARIYEAENEEQGYSFAMKHSIDLFLIDVVLHPGRLGKDQSGAVFGYTMRGVLKYRYTPMVFITKLYDPDFTLLKTIRCFSCVEKPYDPDKLREIIRKGLKFQTQDPRDVPFFYQRDGMLEAVPVRDIVYVDTLDGKLYLHKNGDEDEIVLANKSCVSLMEDFDSAAFLMCRRGTLVNVRYIQKIDSVNRYIYLKGTNKMLEIGPTVRKKFLDAVKGMFKVMN